MIQNDADAVVALKSKNPKAIEYIIEVYGGLIHSVVRKTLTGFEESGYVEECVNDVLFAIWSNAHKFNQTGSFKSWIAAIAKFKGIDKYRSLRCEQMLESMDSETFKEESNEDRTHQELVDRETEAELLKLLDNLKEVDRELIVRKYFKDQSNKEIARDMGIKPEVVNNRLSRGRKQLKVFFFGENKRMISSEIKEEVKRHGR